MDPLVSLSFASQAVLGKNPEWDIAQEALEDYYEWRQKGGYEPKMPNGERGDQRAFRLACFIPELVEKFRELLLKSSNQSVE